MTTPVVPVVRIPTKDQILNAVKSLLRVFLAAALAAYLATGKGLDHLNLGDLKILADAGVGAVILTIANALRSGETRFGLGAVTTAPPLEDVTPAPEDTPLPPVTPVVPAASTDSGAVTYTTDPAPEEPPSPA